MDGSKNHERYLGSFEACYEVSALGNLRSYWTRRALVLAVASFLVISFLPGRALAAGQYYPGQEVIVDGMVAGDGDVGYMCIAYTNFNAALVALGVSVSDARLTNDVRAKLSNASTGGDFYLFASSFFTRAQLNGNLPIWADDVMLQAFISNWENIAGSGPIGPYQDIFYATVSRDLVDSAKRDLQTVLDGGSLGGGGSGGEIDGDYVYYDCERTGYVNDSYTDIAGVALSANLVKCYKATADANSDKDLQLWIGFGTNFDGSKNMVTLNMLTNKPIIQSNYSYSWPGSLGSFWAFSSSHRFPNGGFYQGISKTIIEHNGKKYAYVNNVNPQSVKSYTVYKTTSDAQDAVRPLYSYYWGEVNPGSTGTPVPPTNWPDEPDVSAPTAPEVPEPSEPEIPDQPVQPSAPSLPDFPSNVIVPGTTYPTVDIQAILDAMDEHCRHLQSAIYTGFSDYFDTFTPWLSQELETVRACIRGESEWQMDVLHTELDDLQDYMWQLTRWLAAQLQFDVGGGGYDDSSVVSWLKRIYFKLGGGSVSTRPIDPVVDPGGISDWLDKLFQQLIDALFGVGANVLAQLLEKLQALEEKFPFCIPWDIGAILALMVATPEAPAFDLPCYSLTSEGVQQVGVYAIDLSIFDDYMGPIRSMQTILFAAFLCFKVDWFKSALKMEGLS